MWARRRAGWGETRLGAGRDAVEGRAGTGRGDFAAGRVRGGEGGGERPRVGCPDGMGRRRGRRGRVGRGGRRGKGERRGAVPVGGLAGCVVQRDLAFRLTFVLEPNRDGLHFPVVRASVAPGETRWRRTYMPAACATASRSSRVGWEDWWKSCSSMMSCTLVNRLRVRRAASSEDMLAAEDVLLSVDDSMVVVGDDVQQRDGI